MTLAKFIWQKARRVNKMPGMYPLFYAFANLIYRNGKVVTLRRGPATGYRWRHYRCYQPWMAFGLYEPDVAQLISQTLKPGDVFYDIGANAGYFSLIAATTVGPTGKVIAFDPVPQNVTTVSEQMKLNGFQDICLVESLAVSDINETATLTLPRRNANAHLANIEAPHITDKGGNLIEIKCTTLDSYVSQHFWPTLVKMDIEGAEVKALLGAAKLLSGSKAPTFLITAHSDTLAKQVKNILSNAGYRFSGFQSMIHAVPPSNYQ